MVQQLTDCVQLWAPLYKRDVDTQETFQEQTMKMIKGLEQISCDKRLRLLGLEMRSLGENLIKMYLKRRYKEDVARIFPVVTSDRSRGSRHTMNHRRLYMSNRKPFFSVRVNKHCQSLFREVVGSLSIELLKNNLYKIWITGCR